MKVEIDEHGTLVLKEVFNSIKLVTPDNETITICMRDSGFEACYENSFYSFQKGKVGKVLKYVEEHSPLSFKKLFK